MSTVTTNYSLYSVPAVWGLAIATHWSAIFLSKSSKEIPLFDNVAPRDFHAKIRELAKTSKDAAKFLRIEAAQMNLLENIGWYAAAIVAGNFARLPTKFLNFVAASYLVSRAAFVLLYANTTSRKASAVRSLAYLTSVGLTITTFVKSGNALNRLI
ncbi:hypothetical protein JCM10207_002630 [Rhodosporidiobolus poonsookiae]